MNELTTALLVYLGICLVMLLLLASTQVIACGDPVGIEQIKQRITEQRLLREGKWGRG